jgi:hypothetical protein
MRCTRRGGEVGSIGFGNQALEAAGLRPGGGRYAGTGFAPGSNVSLDCPEITRSKW